MGLSMQCPSVRGAEGVRGSSGGHPPTRQMLAKGKVGEDMESQIRDDQISYSLTMLQEEYRRFAASEKSHG